MELIEIPGFVQTLIAEKCWVACSVCKMWANHLKKFRWTKPLIRGQSWSFSVDSDGHIATEYYRYVILPQGNAKISFPWKVLRHQLHEINITAACPSKPNRLFESFSVNTFNENEYWSCSANLNWIMSRANKISYASCHIPLFIPQLLTSRPGTYLPTEINFRGVLEPFEVEIVLKNIRNDSDDVSRFRPIGFPVKFFQENEDRPGSRINLAFMHRVQALIVWFDNDGSGFDRVGLYCNTIVYKEWTATEATLAWSQNRCNVVPNAYLLIIPPWETLDFSRIEKAKLEFNNLIGQAHIAAVTTKYIRMDD